MKKITLLVFVLLAFMSKGYAQFPQGFEGATFPPAGWTSFIGTNGLGTAQNWKLTTDPDYVSSGSQAAFVRYENVTGGLAQDWLVTPQFTVTAPNVLLSFYEAFTFGGYPCEYTIRVSTTSATDISSFTTVDTKTEDDMPFVMTQRSVDLSAYANQAIYVAFVMTQDDGDNWAIDDVNMEADVNAPECATLTAPADGAVDVAVGPMLDLTWSAPATGDAPASYDVYFGTALPLTNADLLDNFTTTSAQVNVLYSTTYYWSVVPKNLGGEATGCATYSFTAEDPSGSGCLSAPFGQYPLDEVFTSSVCDGVTAETITAFGYAGEYSSMNVINGLTYEFSSSEATDYITISSADATTVYASGTTPVTWTATSDTEVRFYTHADDQCTPSDNELRERSVVCSGLTATVPDCAVMTFPADGAVDVPRGEPVTFTWEAAATGDAPTSYDVYGGTALPLTAADFIDNYTTTSADFTLDDYNTTYYWLVVAKNLAGEAVGCTAFSFTTEASPGYCLDAPFGEFPFDEVFTNSICDGATAQEIVDNGYAGEYSSVAVTAGYTYEFSSSIATDFITISDVDGTTNIISGQTPVTWTATADEVVRFYTHADDQCATNTTLRSRFVMCGGATGSAPDCAVMTYPADGAIDVPTGTVTFTWDAPTTGGIPDSYDFYGGVALPLTAADLIDNVTTTSIDVDVTGFSTTFYWMVVPKNLVGEATGCDAFTFTTMDAPGYCLNAFTTPWPEETFTPTSCDGSTLEDITPDGDGYPGEFSNVNVIAGYTYEFSSSEPTDLITISADDGATAVAYGITPLTWTATADGVVRFYTHLDDQCNTDFSERFRSITCMGDLAIPVFGTHSLKAYPNPVKDVLYLTSEKTISKVQITNLLGQVIFSKTMDATQSQLDVSNLVTGTYLVKVSSGDLTKTIKIIKE